MTSPPQAICPYPDEFTEMVKLADGTEVRLRVVKPEDELAWKDLLARSSRESIWKRFRYLFKDVTHEMAEHFCLVDYDREIPLGAEVTIDGIAKFAAVARVVSDHSGMQAEYGILVADAFQGHGLGMLLTRKCIEICRRRGLKEIVGETTPDNHAMIHIFRTLGFMIDACVGDGAVLAKLRLSGENPPA